MEVQPHGSPNEQVVDALLGAAAVAAVAIALIPDQPGLMHILATDIEAED